MSVSTNKWLKFFSDAGLPASVATNYAIIFTSHRIQNDMLRDLTKEILYDMGIKTMGDVIAILRHAKSVDHNTTRDQLLGQHMTDANASGAKGESNSSSRPTLGQNNQTSRTLAARFKTNAAAVVPEPKPQNSSSQSNIISLKRSAQTSGLIKSTNPKIRRIVVSEEEDLNEDINNLHMNNSSHTVLSLESLKSSSAKSVFSRLGNDKNSDKNSSIFTRLGNNSALDSVNPKRRVTMSGNSISTTTQNNNTIIRLSNNSINSNMRSNKLLITKPVGNRLQFKKPILPPNTGSMRSTNTQPETVSVKNRIGVNKISNTLQTTNRLIVNRSETSNRILFNTSPAIAQAKRIAMRRAAEASNKKRTISLRKNIFDRLGPISL